MPWRTVTGTLTFRAGASRERYIIWIRIPGKYSVIKEVKMSLLIKGMEMPKKGTYICVIETNMIWLIDNDNIIKFRAGEIYEIPTPHGDLIDKNTIQKEMYHKSFETDDDRQKWDSGLWIRYKIFEEAVNNASTVIEREE